MDNEIKFCPKCGKSILDNDLFCRYCGASLGKNSGSTLNNKNLQAECVNCSDKILYVEESAGFNWGAFWLTWIWGIGNKSYITLLYIPALLVNFIFPFSTIALNILFGFMGNEWALKNKSWKSVSEFRKTQKKWGIFGLVFALLSVFLMFLLFILLIFIIATSKTFHEGISNSQALKNYQSYKAKSLSEIDIDEYQGKKMPGVLIFIKYLKNQ